MARGKACNSWMPNSSSSACTCLLMALCVTDSSRGGARHVAQAGHRLKARMKRRTKNEGFIPR